uniref:(northern house mosquito) hypothetical protein n=1 Tax=Culex pipiens TaxID=7175 RepID=A0A8D8GBK2_CULPI
MSSPDVDIDVNVVSSPEPSPRGALGSDSPRGPHSDDEQISSPDSTHLHHSHLQHHPALASHLHQHNASSQHNYHSIASGLSNNNNNNSSFPTVLSRGLVHQRRLHQQRRKADIRRWGKPRPPQDTPAFLSRASLAGANQVQKRGASV